MNKITQTQIFSKKRIYFLLFFFFVLFLSNNSYAENSVAETTVQQVIKQNKITLDIKNKPLKFILNEIHKKSGIGISFKDEGEINKIGNLSITVTNVAIEEALDILLNKTDFSYKIVKNTIVISKKEEQQPKPRATTTEKVKIMGSVLDTSKKPIVGATIFVQDTNDGAITDEHGSFTIYAVQGSSLEATFVGKKPLVLPVENSDKQLVFELKDDILNVQDVVVTGIFNKSRESYTGAVTTVTAKDIRMFKGQNLLQTLKNIDPAFNVIMNNDLGSDPNRLPEVNIRGNSSLPMSVKELNENAQAQLNTPLVIMDGFEINLQKLMDFNDEEIESINIMKDAAATAIYGSRGANGVIVITTKAPVAGKLKIFVQGGFNIEIPDITTYDVLNAREKLALEVSADAYKSEDLTRKQRYADVLKDIISGVDTDWISQPIRTGIGQRYNARLEGGSNEFKWGTSLQYNDVKGVMKGSEKKTFNGSVILSYTLKNIIFRNQTSIGSNKGINSPYGGFDTYIKMNPYWKIRNDNGEIIKSYSTYDGRSKGNPLYDATLNTKDSDDYLEVINNFSIDWTIVDGLRVTAKFGISSQNNHKDNFKPASHSSFVDYSAADFFKKGNYKYTTGNQLNYDGNITLNYSKVFAQKHNLYFGFDYSISQRDSYSYNIEVDGFSNDNFDFMTNANTFTKNKPSGSESVSRRIGLTGNLNYTYDNRYFADMSFRMDGSSQFGTNQKFAPFWSMGVGWNIHREKFAEDFGIVNNFRIRGSYGETGSQQFSSYQALATYEYFTSDRYMFWNGAALKAIGNPDLKWQKTKQYNGGVELGLWNNRLIASADFYLKQTSNLLSQMDLPGMNGFTSYAENVGAVKNTGGELMVSGYLIRNISRNVMWSITAKMAYNKNTIDKLSDAIKKQNESYLASGSSNSNLLFEGDPANAIYVVPSLGIDPSTGKEVFIDRFGNRTYTWDYRDRVFMGVDEPKWRSTISSMFSYKDFTINMSFGVRFGGQQYNQTLIDKVENADYRLNVDRRVYEERWQKPGDIVAFKGINETAASKYSSRFVQDETTFEMQSLSISYRLSNKWLSETFRINSMNIGCNMSDVFHLSSIKRERGTSYPFARRISLNLSLLF